MKLSANISSKQNQSSSLPLREGAVYRANILERRGNNEATIRLNNWKIHAIFQGGMPKQNNIAFQVTNRKEGELQVRALTNSQNNIDGQNRAVSTSSILKNLGVHQPSNAVKSGASILLDLGTALTKTSTRSLQNFMEKSSGTTEQKLQTVQAAANKRIDITENNLRDIHEGLHSKSAVNFMKSLSVSNYNSQESQTQMSADKVNEAVKQGIRAAEASDKEGLKETVQNIRTQLQKGEEPSKALKEIKEKIINHSALTERQRSDAEKGVKEVENFISKGKTRQAKEVLSDTLKTEGALPREKSGAVSSSLIENIQDIRYALHNGGSAKETIKQIQREVLNHPELTKEQASQLKQAIKEAEQLSNAGREKLDNALRTLEKSAGTKMAPAPMERLEEPLHQLRKELQAGAPADKVLQKIKQLLQQGDKREIAQTLDRVLSQMASSSAGNKGAMHLDIQQALEKAGFYRTYVREMGKLINQSEQLHEAGRKHMINILDKIELTGKERANVQEMLPSLKNKVNQEPDLNKLLNQVRGELVPSLPNRLQPSAAEQTAKAQVLLDQRKELASRQHTHRLLEDLTKAMQVNDNQSKLSSYVVNEAIQTSVPFESKQLLETRITEKLIKVADDFKQIKQDTLKQLEQASKLIRQDKQSAPQAKKILEAAIKKLDRAILRSDVMLFTDMKTERQLLQASGQLAEAKQLLGKGKIAEAHCFTFCSVGLNCNLLILVPRLQPINWLNKIIFICKKTLDY
ncbi:hypothetical protein [Alteribacillus bidgolensis]|uniref:hypothetical protein n=1 Tax=Alteribacillus bidgolensis TaxID=930129 RepID=UPI000B8984B0|nr:hypothetical protein [Alteribacillus bidgolensis]